MMMGIPSAAEKCTITRKIISTNITQKSNVIFYEPIIYTLMTLNQVPCIVLLKGK